MTRYRRESTWEPSEEAWQSVESKWDGARREYVQIRELGRVRHDAGNPKKRSYEEMYYDSSTPPVLVGLRHGKYVLVDGHHRVLGAKLRKFGSVPAVVVPGLHLG